MSEFRSKTNLLDRRPLDDRIKPCEHDWEEFDFGRKVQCSSCGEVRTAGVASLHHRSCHLRRGGNTCTC